MSRSGKLELAAEGGEGQDANATREIRHYGLLALSHVSTSFAHAGAALSPRRACG
jgi:hypothetical protein